MFGGQHTTILSNNDDKEIHRNLICFLLKLLDLMSVQNLKAVEIISYVSFVALPLFCFKKGNEVLLSGYSAYIMSHRGVTIANVSGKSKSYALQCNE